MRKTVDQVKPIKTQLNSGIQATMSRRRRIILTPDEDVEGKVATIQEIETND